MMRSPSSPRRSRQLTCRPPHSGSTSCGSLRHICCSAGACWQVSHAPHSAQLCLCKALASHAAPQASTLHCCCASPHCSTHRKQCCVVTQESPGLPHPRSEPASGAARRGAPSHTSSPPQAPRPRRAPQAPAAGPAHTGALCISTTGLPAMTLQDTELMQGCHWACEVCGRRSSSPKSAFARASAPTMLPAHAGAAVMHGAHQG